MKFLLAAATTLMSVLFVLPLEAGSGTVSNDGKVDLTVKFLYPPPQGDIDDLTTMLAEASTILCDATDGGMRLDDVKLTGGSTVGLNAADVWVLNKTGKASATACWKGENVVCYALPIEGTHVNLPRNKISAPSTMAHELGHLVLDLGDEYDKESCASSADGTIQKGVCQECGVDPDQTCLMHAEMCGSNYDYSELCTETNHDLVRGQGTPCADFNDVFPGVCDPETACFYDEPYDPFEATPYDRCEAFDLSTCFYERSGQTWWSLLKFGEELDCWSHADKTHPSILDEVTDLPEPDPPAACNTAPQVDVQLDEPDQLVLVLDRSWSMAFQPGDDEKCPDSGCVEICGNGDDDDEDGFADEDDPEGCVEPRINFLKEAAEAVLLLFVDLYDDSTFEAGIVSFNCDTTEDVGLTPLTGEAFNGQFEPTIADLQPDGGTAIADGLQAGADMLDGGGEKAIFLVTDGFENCGAGCAGDAIDMLEDQGIAVYWTSFGPAIGSETEACYASKADGNWINPPTAREMVPAFAQQFAKYLNAGLLIPQLHYDLFRFGTTEDPATARTPQSWLDGEDESSFCPPESPCRTNTFEVHVEEGTERLAVVLGGDMGDMSGFGVRAKLTGPPGPNPTTFDTEAAGPDPYMEVKRSEFYMTTLIADPNPGTWRIELSVSDLPGVADTQTGNLSVIARNDEAFFFTSLEPRHIENAGDTVQIHAVPYIDGDVDRATVEVKLYRPDGSTVSVTMDDLSEFDANYFAEIGALPFQGVYQARILMRTDPAVSTIDQGEHYDGELPEVMAPFVERTAVEYFVATTGTKVCDSGTPSDCDGDGIPGESGTSDFDGDGLPDDCDLDADGDELGDYDENPDPPDTDGDGVPDYLDDDSDGDGAADQDDPGIVVGTMHNIARLLDVDVDTCGHERKTYAFLGTDQAVTGFDFYIDWVPAGSLDLLSIALGPDVDPNDVASLTTDIETNGLGPGEARATLTLVPGATLGAGQHLRVLELMLQAPLGVVPGSDVSLCFDPGAAAPLTTVTVVVVGGGTVEVTPQILCGAATLVGDTDPPDLNCPDHETVPLDAACNASWNESATVDDDCDPSPVVTTTPPLPLSFAAPGVTEVIYTATDADANSSACATTVTAADLSPPTGSILSPADGTCSPAPVVVTDDFFDNCDGGAVMRTYTPTGGPTYSSHGDYTVVLDAADQSGNVATDSVSFVIDLVPPTVDVPAEQTVEVPSVILFSELFSSDDADGASGEVVAESLAVDGCPAADGASLGDGDGLLSDEELPIDLGLACELAATCGLGTLDEHVLTVEAVDCAGNATVVSGGLSFEPAVPPQDCQVALRVSRLPDGSTLVSGTPVFEADGYDIVRGELSNVSESGGVIDLGPVTCLGSALATPTVIDDTDPAPRQAVFYLARWFHGPTTTEYGWSSTDLARVPASGDCPPN